MHKTPSCGFQFVLVIAVYLSLVHCRGGMDGRWWWVLEMELLLRPSQPLRIAVNALPSVATAIFQYLSVAF